MAKQSRLKKASQQVSLKTLYDWKVAGRSLKVIDGSGFVNLIIGGDTTFEEMYRKGYLTGQALKDAEKKFGKLKETKFKW